MSVHEAIFLNVNDDLVHNCTQCGAIYDLRDRVNNMSVALERGMGFKISKSRRQAVVAVEGFGPKGGLFVDALGLDLSSGIYRAGLFFGQIKGSQHGRIMCRALPM